VFDESASTSYVHHDIALPSFPLALQYINVNPADGKQGAFVAVGTFQPAIEIWNLDMMDVMEPTAVLGGRHAVDSSQPLSAETKAKGKQNVLRCVRGPSVAAPLSLCRLLLSPWVVTSLCAHAVALVVCSLLVLCAALPTPFKARSRRAATRRVSCHWRGLR
jgi:periodic tryptophan protein 1